MKIRDSLNFNLGDFNEDFEYPDPISVTIPDESYTIPEILEKYTKGIAPQVALHGFYESDTPDFDSIDPTKDPAFDIVDATELFNDFQNMISEKKAAKEATSKSSDSMSSNDAAEPAAKKAAEGSV